MRVGQPATVTLDIYGSSIVYEGKVLGIASGTGSIFSIIPPQNATGNWIKIVQRLPVRISLDPETVKQYPVRLSLSAYATVNVTDTTLPKLVQTITTTPVSTTNVFELDLTEVNKIIDAIVEGA
jgi:membrane fusion protein (multidrug efflux system)